MAPSLPCRGETDRSMFGNNSSGNTNSTAWSQEFVKEASRILFMVILVVAITLGNLLILLVFLRIKQFRTPHGYLKASLALADLAVGILIVPYSLYREVKQLSSGAKQEIGPVDQVGCLITGLLFACCTFVSITTIFLLSLERGVAVLKPLQMKTVVTKRRTGCLVLLSWVLSFSLAVIPLLSVRDISFQYDACSKLCNYAFPPGKPPESHWNIMLLYPVFDLSLMSSTFLINMVTFAALHRYCKLRLGSTQLSFSEINAAKTIGILTFVFSVSFMPIAVFVVGSVVGHQWCQFSFYAFWILTANSCWNVVIYSVWDPRFRQGVRGLFNKQVLRTASQFPSCSVDVRSSSPACVASFKEMGDV